MFGREEATRAVLALPQEAKVDQTAALAAFGGGGGELESPMEAMGAEGRRVPCENVHFLCHLRFVISLRLPLLWREL